MSRCTANILCSTVLAVNSKQYCYDTRIVLCAAAGVACLRVSCLVARGFAWGEKDDELAHRDGGLYLTPFFGN